MKPNVGGADRIFRIVAGIAIIGIGIYNQSWWGAIGVLPLLTAIFRFCPAYTLVKCSTGCSGSSPEKMEGGSCCGHGHEHKEAASK